jgi:hypothetical protein
LIERSVILSTGAVLTGSLPELSCKSKLSAPVTLDGANSSHILQTLQQTEVVLAGSERRCRPAGPAADGFDLQDEAAGY